MENYILLKKCEILREYFIWMITKNYEKDF